MHQAVELGKNFRVLEKKWLSDVAFSVWLEAPDIARAFRAGQFVIVRLDEDGERIPLTIAEVDERRTRIRLVVQIVGLTTRQMSSMRPSDHVLDVVGPLGRPVEIRKYPGPIVGVAGGVGAAPLLPQMKAYRDAGNKTLAIMGARNTSRLLLVDEMRRVAHDLHLTTDDGSFIRKGLVTDVLTELLERGLRPSLIIAIGPAVMMKATCELATKRSLPIMVSLNPIMVDGTGMCGGCRVTVASETFFACVDGPDFDGSQVNWDELISRLDTYKHQEKIALNHACRIGRRELR